MVSSFSLLCVQGDISIKKFLITDLNRIRKSLYTYREGFFFRILETVSSLACQPNLFWNEMFCY